MFIVFTNFNIKIKSTFSCTRTCVESVNRQQNELSDDPRRLNHLSFAWGSTKLNVLAAAVAGWMQS